MESAGFFSNHDEEAEAWTKRYVLALAILYAGSATAFGVPDYRWFDRVERTWLTVVFESKSKLDETLDEVGRAVRFSFSGNRSFERDPNFFTPLIRSLVTGSGFHVAGQSSRLILRGSRSETSMFASFVRISFAACGLAATFLATTCHVSCERRLALRDGIWGRAR